MERKRGSITRQKEWDLEMEEALRKKRINELLEKFQNKKYIIQKLEENKNDNLSEEDVDTDEKKRIVTFVKNLSKKEIEKFIGIKSKELEKIIKELEELIKK